MSEKNLQVLLKSYPTGWVGAEHFDLVEAPMPAPADGEVLVRNVYLSADPYMRGRMSDSKDRYVAGFKIGEPISGYAVAEVVESRHSDFAAGDWVTSPALRWEHFSALSGDRSALRKVTPGPVPLSYYLGVLGMPGMTAYVGLLDIGEPKEGETVFVSAASGAVGQIVGQIAKMKGCRVVGAAGSDQKIAYLLDDLGFDSAFNYKKVDKISKALREHCPKGIDVYFENVGGETLDAVLARMNTFGRIVACGMISQYNLERPEGIHNLINVVGQRLKMQGFIVSDHLDRAPQFQSDVTGWLTAGKIKYREDLAQGLENAPAALIGMLQGKNFGKQVIQIAADANRK